MSLKQTKCTTEQIINALRKAELMIAQGKTVKECC